MKKQRLPLCFVLCLAAVTVQAQPIFQTVCQIVKGSGPSEINATAFTEEDQTDLLLQHVLSHVGLPPNFEMRAADSVSCPNASAVIYYDSIKGQWDRYILYNQEFMRQVRVKSRTDWGPLAVLLHEAGHHLSGHTLIPGGSNHNKEIEADHFIGFMMYKIGATLEQAQIGMRVIAQEEDAPTHPGRAKRLAAIEAGWRQAKSLEPMHQRSYRQKKPPQKPSRG